MPKRSRDEKIERYRKKLRRLEQKEEQKSKRLHRRLVIETSSEESDVDNHDDTGDFQELLGCDNLVANNVSPPEQKLDSVDESEMVPELDPDILSALGEAVDESPPFGPPIHKNLALRWTAILKKGTPKEIKEKLLKDYPIPENCSLLQAPKLNPEISAAISDIARARDKKMEVVQQQLGVGITCINRALSLLLTTDEKIQAIKLMSDGCRILTDLHYMNSVSRAKLLTPGLDKSFLTILKDTERDVQLFGCNLSEKIKASKVIEKQGLQIKKVSNYPKPSVSTTVTSAVTRPRYQENWPGPSRYPTTRGGRGGGRKPTFTGRRNPPNQFTQHRAPSKNKNARGQQ